ncbi:hypothetical protein GCM10009678_21490 [Actinomadura kijaniata]|uniref:Uncharacterized protein n=1 Tax=Actinomadura namibiensis TaxID=182080 RepID=A0A7W3LJ49_ACTNM|nr:hypothetical protein [Actinomadura namibiensis]
MSPPTTLLASLRETFPDWDIWVCDRGVWRATGPTLLSASTAEKLIEHLVADPDALKQHNTP